jgi:hypothetical protein
VPASSARALAGVIELFNRECGRTRPVFNGDFHWFDPEPRAFAGVQDQVLRFDALRGNIETELAYWASSSSTHCRPSTA